MKLNRISILSRTTQAALSASLLLAMSASTQTALAQSAPTVIPPVTPDGPTPPTVHSWSSSSSTWSITTNEDGRTIKIESKNGAILAEVDGKAVPADRVIHEGNTVTIKDEKGNVLIEQQVPGGDTATRIYTITGNGPQSSIAVAPRATIRGRSLSTDPLDRTIHVQVDAPKVMIGVQLLDPDASIRGHLGLKEDETTMVSGVYEGLPAAAAGLEPYDIIVSVGGKTPAPPATVRKLLREVEAGKSISFEVIHRGVKKTVTVTPEKYDGDKIDKAKLNAIAAASGATAPAANSAFDKQFAEAWAQQAGQSPFVATIPGQPGKPSQPMMLWRGLGGANSQDFAKHMQDIAAQAQEQAKRAQEEAERAREQAERMMRDQMQAQPGLSPFTTPGAPGMVDINRLMEERMKKMEQMMQQLLDHQGTKPAEPKADGNKS